MRFQSRPPVHNMIGTKYNCTPPSCTLITTSVLISGLVTSPDDCLTAPSSRSSSWAMPPCCQSICLTSREREHPPGQSRPALRNPILTFRQRAIRLFHRNWNQVLQELDHLTHTHGSQPRHIRPTRRKTKPNSYRNLAQAPLPGSAGSATMTHQYVVFLPQA